MITELMDESGRLRHDQPSIDRIRQLVHSEPLLRHLDDLRHYEMSWSSQGLHFVGLWIPTHTAAVLKLGLSDRQLAWAVGIPELDEQLAPPVLAHGRSLSGISVNWILTEKFPGGLHEGWKGKEFSILMEAGVRFQSLTRRYQPGPWSDLTCTDIMTWIYAALERHAPGKVNEVLRRFDNDWNFLRSVCELEICHGDLHMANVLMRTPPPRFARATLIDFEPCRMPWVFDAAYCQVLNSDPRRRGWQDLVATMARYRQLAGMQTCSASDLKRISAISLAWYALRMWGMIGATPDPRWRTARLWRNTIKFYIDALAETPGLRRIC